MRIHALYAENIKKLKVVRITPKGALIQITGPNDSGKTSVLDSLLFGLGGQKLIDAMPLREGTEKGLIRIDLGDKVVEIIATRRFTKAGGTSLVLEAAGDGDTAGAEFKSPQSKLDKLLGALTFDPLAFSRMEPKLQLDELRKMVKLDVDIDQIDFDNRRDFEERTAVNRAVKDLTSRVAAIVIAADVPEEPVLLESLMGDMEAATEHNRLVDQEATRRGARVKEIVDSKEDLERVERQIEALTQTRDQMASKIRMLEDAALAEAPLPEKRDLTVYRTKMADAQATNAKVSQRTEKARLAGELAAAEGQSAKLTKQMEDRTKVRQDAITAAKMPIEGLGFGDGFVTHNGVPFQQASSAQQLRASVAIAMAANPKLRIMRIKDGSLLDENGLALLEQMAEEQNFQIWLEKVDTSGTGQIVMEDGEVAAVNA